MAKRPVPIEGSLAEELYNLFIEFIDTKGGVPIERAFWGWLIRQGKYKIEVLPEWTFRYQFGRLIAEGWITVEPDTRALVPRKNPIKVDT